MTKQNWQQLLAVLVALIVLALMWQLWQLITPAIKAMVPFLAWTLLIAGEILIVALLVGVIGGIYVLLRRQHVEAQTRLIESRKMPANERGFIGAYIDETKRGTQILLPPVTAFSVETPAHVHIQTDTSNKGAGPGGDWRAELEWAKLEWEKEKVRLLNAPSEQKLISAPRPTIEAIVRELADDELEFSTGTSLTTQNLIKVGLKGKHIKVIGGSQMGKTSLIGAILEQMRLKYPVGMLRLAILDLEDMTGLLFEDDPHILEVPVNGELRKVHARNPIQVAEMLTWLDTIMLFRYELIQKKGLAYVERQPRILIYIEEFLDWKKTLVQRVPDEKLRDAAIAAINALSTRGLKVGMHLLIAAQVDYADKELQSAMAQFVGLNVAFAVKPKAAQAAGFVDSARLAENYAQKRPGQYVVEMIGGGDMGISPEFDVKGKIKALQQDRAGDDEIIDGEFEEMGESQMFPAPSVGNFQTEQRKHLEMSPETAQEKAGNEIDQETGLDAFTLKNFLVDARKRRAEGVPLNTILKEYGLPSGGRMHQDVQAFLDDMDDGTNQSQAANE